MAGIAAGSDEAVEPPLRWAFFFITFAFFNIFFAFFFALPLELLTAFFIIFFTFLAFFFLAFTFFSFFAAFFSLFFARFTDFLEALGAPPVFFTTFLITVFLTATARFTALTVAAADLFAFLVVRAA